MYDKIRGEMIALIQQNKMDEAEQLIMQADLTEGERRRLYSLFFSAVISQQKKYNGSKVPIVIEILGFVLIIAGMILSFPELKDTIGFSANNSYLLAVIGLGMVIVTVLIAKHQKKSKE